MGFIVNSLQVAASQVLLQFRDYPSASNITKKCMLTQATHYEIKIKWLPFLVVLKTTENHWPYVRWGLFWRMATGLVKLKF